MLDEGEDFFSPTSKLAINFPDMVKGGLDVQVFALYIAPGLPPGKTIKRAMSMAGTFFQAVEASRGRFVMARTVKEVRAAVASGRKCGLLAIEGGQYYRGRSEYTAIAAKYGSRHHDPHSCEHKRVG